MTRIALIAVLALSTAACHKKVAAPEPPRTAAAPAATPVEQAIATLQENFARVHFDFDSSALTAESKKALDANAAILAKHKTLVVEVQGHADERGTTDYNVALGERRATAVRDRMVLQGAGARQVRTLSYGEERPLSTGTGETVWCQNRRAEFKILVGGVGVSGTTVQ